MDVLTRATFNAARDGDKSAVLLMEQAASEGSKEAEGILLQLTRENMAETGEQDFVLAFTRTAAANELLHRAYLSGNGTKW